MKSKKQLMDFVRDTIQQIKDFNSNDLNHVKEVIRLAIVYYDLKTFEKFEEREILYIASIIEENMLSKIASLTIANGKESSIEYIYHGYVVRNY